MGHDIPVGQVLTSNEAESLSLEHDLRLCRYVAMEFLRFFDQPVEELPGGDHRTAIRNMLALLSDTGNEEWRRIVMTFLDRGVQAARAEGEEPWSNNEKPDDENLEPVLEPVGETVQHWGEKLCELIRKGGDITEVIMGDPIMPPGSPVTVSTVEWKSKKQPSEPPERDYDRAVRDGLGRPLSPAGADDYMDVARRWRARAQELSFSTVGVDIERGLSFIREAEALEEAVNRAEEKRHKPENPDDE